MDLKMIQPLAVGSSLPQFELQLSNQKTTTDGDLSQENGLVLAFLHGTWCPACIQQLTQLNRLAPDLEKHEVGLAAC